MLFRRKREALSMSLEGALGANGRLDAAEALRVMAPEALCVDRAGHLLVSSGSQLLRLERWGQEPELWASFEAPVTALTVSEGGRVAVGLLGGQICFCDAS